MLTTLFLGISSRVKTQSPSGMGIFLQLAIGAVIGFVLGRLAVRLINGIRMDNASLYPVLLLMIGIFVFAATYFLKGNGYLAIYIAGLVIGNSKFVHKRTSMKFMDGFAWMSQILLFLTLGLLVNPAELLEVLLPAVIIASYDLLRRPLSFSSLCCLSGRFSSINSYLWGGLRGACHHLRHHAAGRGY